MAAERDGRELSVAANKNQHAGAQRVTLVTAAVKHYGC